MENQIELYQISSNDVQHANFHVQAPTPFVPGNLNNLKLPKFNFSDEGKARSRNYLKKLVN